jgi:CheY-like chemotaxis protein
MQALDYLYRRDDYANRPSGNPVLVLLDLKMPLLDGIGVLKEIKGSEHLHNIPVVVLTSSTEPSDLQRAYDAGTNAYIAKPTEFSQFLSAMKHVCEFWININQTAPQTSHAGVRTSGFGELM